MANPKVKLSEVVMALEGASDEFYSYFDRETGAVTMALDVERLADLDDEEAATHPEWEQDDIKLVRAIQADEEKGGERFVALPSKFDIDGYHTMEAFVLGIEDDAAREALYRAIKGRGAFRRFKDEVHSRGLADEWYKYRDESLKELAVEWCEANGIAYTED